MSAAPRADLRALVSEVVRETVRAEVRRQAAAAETTPVASSGPTDVDTVRITGDADLQAFVHRLLALFENPKTREDVRTGRLRFTLAGGVAAPAAQGRVRRVEKGAVTERAVAEAARAGESIVLGRRAVLTPLAREKARHLSVPVEKEH